MAGTVTTVLPYIDEHSVVVRVDDPGRVWEALGERIGRLWRVPDIPARILRAEPAVRAGEVLHAGSTIPGFAIVRSEPTRELVMEGSHRFSSYSLTFRLVSDGVNTTLSAETRAAFPGASGRIYRGLVIGSRGHLVLVRGFLRAVRDRAQG